MDVLGVMGGASPLNAPSSAAMSFAPRRDGATAGAAPAAAGGPVDKELFAVGSPVPGASGSPTSYLLAQLFGNVTLDSNKALAADLLADAARAAAQAGTAEAAAASVAATPAATPVALPAYSEAHLLACGGDAEALRDLVDEFQEAATAPAPVVVEPQQQQQEGALNALTAADHTGNTPLHYACDSSSHATARYLLENGAALAINAQNFAGRTPLHAAIAAAYNDEDEEEEEEEEEESAAAAGAAAAAPAAPDALVQLLLTVGASPNVADLEGATALHAAAATGDAALVHTLIHTAGAWVDAVDLEGDSPLAYAVRDEHADVARVLIAAGANTALANEDGETPADLAALSGPELQALFTSINTHR